MFDKVYRIAIESKNFEELKRGLNKLHIDALALKDGALLTPAAQLAREGKNDKVEWMRLLGADIHIIASGYALGGNHDQVKVYRKGHSANVGNIAHGYALAGNHQQVEVYRTKYNADVDQIARGYALAGNHQQVEVYRTKYNADVQIIANAYAMAGNHEQVEAYRKNYGGSIDAIVYGYAVAGNHEQVETYRRNYGADANEIAKLYAQLGNHEKQKKYDINCLLDSYLKERTAVIDSSGRTKEYFYGSFFSVFQQSFTNKRAAVIALKSALNGDNVDLSTHLSALRNGTLGKELRAFVKSGMGNALVGKEVNTVSDFVHALQDKNSKQVAPLH